MPASMHSRVYDDPGATLGFVRGPFRNAGNLLKSGRAPLANRSEKDESGVKQHPIIDHDHRP